MKLFYIAVTKEGKRVRGFVEAADQSKAASYLRDRSFIPIRIELEKPKSLNPSFAFLHKISSKDRIFFTRQLASMLASGINLTQALAILKNQTQKQQMVSIIHGLITSIEEGKSFSEALTQYPEVFSPIYISLMRASESSGLLDKIMLRLADTLEKQAKLKSQIISALLYPLIVITLMIGVVIVLLVVVIPQLSGLYTSLNVELPLPTKIIVDLSNFVIHYLIFIIIGLLIGLYYLRKWRQTERGRIFLDNLILRIPIFSKLIKESTMVEFARTFGLLVGTGALIIDSLKKSADVLSNTVYKKAIMQVADNVEQGVTIGDAMQAMQMFPPILIEMVKIGEQTGKLDDSLMRVSEYFEREVEQTVKALTTAMEPIIMIMLAVGVLFLVIAVITPIYKLMSAI